jgi:glycosyltransferase involved in cell wall biosynthesis
MVNSPKVTIAIPSYNQGRYLDDTLSSIFSQKIPVEVYVLDGGSSDNSIDVIKKWEKQIAGWRSHNDEGQSAAINEGIAQGRAPYVSWLNSDDWIMPDGLRRLIYALDNSPRAPVVYGRVWNYFEKNQTMVPVDTEPFCERRLAVRCIISQPATIIRRSAWESVGGLNEKLTMAMDYDLWWKLYKEYGPFRFLDEFVAANREHAGTKTRNKRKTHYMEAISVVRKHYGCVPLKWFFAQPYAIWFKTVKYWLEGKMSTKK